MHVSYVMGKVAIDCQSFHFGEAHLTRIKVKSVHDIQLQAKTKQRVSQKTGKIFSRQKQL